MIWIRNNVPGNEAGTPMMVQKVRRFLAEDRWVAIRPSGSHRVFKRKICIVVIPIHNCKDMGQGSNNSIPRQPRRFDAIIDPLKLTCGTSQTVVTPVYTFGNATVVNRRRMWVEVGDRMGGNVGHGADPQSLPDRWMWTLAGRIATSSGFDPNHLITIGGSIRASVARPAARMARQSTPGRS